MVKLPMPNEPLSIDKFTIGQWPLAISDLGNLNYRRNPPLPGSSHCGQGLPLAGGDSRVDAACNNRGSTDERVPCGSGREPAGPLPAFRRIEFGRRSYPIVTPACASPRETANP